MKDIKLLYLKLELDQMVCDRHIDKRKRNCIR